MAESIAKEEVHRRFTRELQAGNMLLGSGAGNGLIARIVEKNGGDFIVVYNSGHYRVNGHASILGHLPLGDANQIVLDLGERDILPIVADIPVFAGVYGVDPTRDMRRHLRKIQSVGFSGVINYPTVGRIRGEFRRELEASGLGFQKEVDMIRLASAAGLYTTAYVCTPEDARSMAAAGVDLLIAHVGLTVGGDVGAKEGASLEAALLRTEEILRAGLRENPSVIPLCHGGPIVTPEDARTALEMTCAAGFVGASSIERLPVEESVGRMVYDYKKMRNG